MDLDLRIKLIIVGLLVISLAGVYLIFSNRIASDKQSNTIVENPPVVQNTPVPVSTTAPRPSGPPQVVGQNQNYKQNLPNTAFPSYFLGVIALSGAVTGFFLRKFPQ